MDDVCTDTASVVCFLHDGLNKGCLARGPQECTLEHTNTVFVLFDFQTTCMQRESGRAIQERFEGNITICNS